MYNRTIVRKWRISAISSFSSQSISLIQTTRIVVSSMKGVGTPIPSSGTKLDQIRTDCKLFCRGGFDPMDSIQPFLFFESHCHRYLVVKLAMLQASKICNCYFFYLRAIKISRSLYVTVCTVKEKKTATSIMKNLLKHDHVNKQNGVLCSHSA